MSELERLCREILDRGVSSDQLVAYVRALRSGTPDQRQRALKPLVDHEVDKVVRGDLFEIVEQLSLEEFEQLQLEAESGFESQGDTNAAANQDEQALAC